jgi:hypothetical protein
MSDQHALYRFFDADENLLYIGITMNPAQRWRAHAHDKQWWHEVADIRIEKQSSRAAALTAEAVAIREECPRYNIVHAAPLPTQPGGTVPFKCECGAPGTAMYVLYRDIARRKEQLAQWEADTTPPNGGMRVLSGSQLLSCPERAWWRACCDSHPPEESHYWFDMPATHEGWLSKTAHLLDTRPSWAVHTNWAEIIGSVKSLTGRAG